MLGDRLPGDLEIATLLSNGFLSGLIKLPRLAVCSGDVDLDLDDNKGSTSDECVLTPVTVGLIKVCVVVVLSFLCSFCGVDL